MTTPDSFTKKRIDLVPGNCGRILLLSLRRVADLVAFCAPYEFEDVIVELTGADVVRPGTLAGLEVSRKVYKLVRYTTRSTRLADAITPMFDVVHLDKDYELFFPIFNHPHELFALYAIPDWRERCRTAICFISEPWANLLPDYLVELLSRFDKVFIGLSHSVNEIERIVGRPCSYLPLGVDMPTFCPYPDPPVRAIDICNIGRRSPITHDALLTLARARKLFYYYDTVSSNAGVTRAAGRQTTFRVSNPQDHRFLLANVLKRSRYFFAHHSRANEPEVTRGNQEISSRFVEGAAAGTVMLGQAPDTEEFRTHFGWTDAVIPAPFDSPDIGDLILALDQDPERTSRIRRDNIVNALLRHDWSYRLSTVLEAAGLRPTAQMLERQGRLSAMASELQRTPIHAA
jgi:hypothetical protein